jgi:NADPH:quinone reductase-like Zn-dependent oxidoreductase
LENNQKMKAVLYTAYGHPEVLRILEVEKPIPKENEILIKVHAATITAADILFRNGKSSNLLFSLAIRLMNGIKAPKKKILGHEFAGEIEAVGKDVTNFKRGDCVFGTTSGLVKTGSYAEYICVPQEWGQGVVTTMPTTTNYQEAAAVPVGGMTALHLLRKANIKTGQKVLIYGASGSVGTYAVQLAKYFGAEVTGVCSASNVELIKSIGADFVIDYTKGDYTRNGQKYDVVFDAVGKTTSGQNKGILNQNGRYVSVKSPTTEKIEKLNFLKGLLDSGKIKAVIDRTYPMDKIVEAHEYVQRGHKKGNVVIIVDNAN